MTSYASGFVPTTNVRVSDVAETLGAGTCSVVDLCTSDKVNRYSVNKPRNSYAGSADFGFKLTWVDNLNKLLAVYGKNGLYEPDYTPTKPYHLGDFRGYQHQASAPSMTVRISVSQVVSASVPIPKETGVVAPLGLGSFLDYYPGIVLVGVSQGDFRAIVTTSMTVRQYIMEYTDAKPTMSLTVGNSIVGYSKSYRVLPVASRYSYPTAVSTFGTTSPMVCPLPWTTLSIGAPATSYVTTDSETVVGLGIEVTMVYTSAKLGSWMKGITMKLTNKKTTETVKLASILIRRTYTNKDISDALTSGESEKTFTNPNEFNGELTSWTNIDYVTDHLEIAAGTTGTFYWLVDDTYSYAQYTVTGTNGKAVSKSGINKKKSVSEL